MPTPRLTYCSVTNFLCHGDEYLFIHRGPHKKIDANRLNGIGGKLEHGENYVEAAIRETTEETGYTPDIKDLHFAGVVRIQGGYEQDWIVCFFKIDVPHKIVPHGHPNEEGELLWIHKDEVLNTEFELVDDIKILFPLLATGKTPFFFTAQMTDKEKVGSYTIELLDQPL